MPGRDPTATLERSAAPVYRPDIDGLRALAVLAVILFHAGIPGVNGGYAGVDVFFVISGYLITQLLEQSRGRPLRRALGDFYLRRVRRILPALLVTCAVTAVAAVVLFIPEQLVRVGKYLAATPLFMSNLASWSDGGYFVERSGLPLNHLWSVAVEEQFYLLYPLVLLLITRYLPYRRRAAVVALAIASLALCVWASYAHPTANYLIAPTRAWELLLGAALALGAGSLAGGLDFAGGGITRELLAAAAVLCIAIAVHVFGAGTPYPGIAAILPCAATAVLIATGTRGQPTFVNRALSWRPLVFLGLISYSLYLWHQPLLVFVRYYRIEPLSPLATVLVLAATGLLAAGSWRFIEQPVRTRRLLRAPTALVSAAVLASVAVFVAGVILWRSNGFPQRFPPASRLLFTDKLGGAAWRPCTHETPEGVSAGRLCSGGSQNAHSSVLVWGDSHALSAMPAYAVLAHAHAARLYLAFKAFCPPLLGPSAPRYQPLTGRGTQALWCANFNSAVLQAIERLDPQIVILDARWIDAELPAGVTDIASGIVATMQHVAAAGRSVCVVLGVPAFAYSPPYALTMARLRNIDEGFLRLSRAAALAQFHNMEPTVRAFARAHASVAVADPKDALCPKDNCLYAVDGRSLYYDSNHLSPYGARYVAGALESCFRPVRPASEAVLHADSTR